MAWNGKPFHSRETDYRRIKTFIANQFGGPERIIACEIPVDGECYLAFKNNETVLGAVVLYEFKDGHIWFKGISEEEGPVRANCPAAILDLLGPAPNAWADEWREKCRLQNLALIR